MVSDSNSNCFFTIPQKAEIRKGNLFLVVRRGPAAPTHPNCWDFPGGRLENGETPEEGLKREVKEETNLTIKVLKPNFVFTEKLKDHYAQFVVYECRLVSGKLRLSREHREARWATKKEILKLNTEKFLREYLKAGKA